MENREPQEAPKEWMEASTPFIRPVPGRSQKEMANTLQKGTKMNRPIVTLVIAIVCCALVVAFAGAGRATGVAGESGQVGRFALESGEYMAPSISAVTRLPGIFKIDTATGKVWRHDSEVVGGKAVEKWIPISE